jgi:L-amino acid N-acyltransferase YncA
MLNVRYATIQDAKAIATVHVYSWQTVYRGHIPDNILDNLSCDGREKSWKLLLENHSRVLLLEEDKNIFGFISFCPSRDQDADSTVVAEISALYLSPDKWRKGYGKLLCNTALNEIKKSGYHQVTLWVLDGNHQARKFYANMGFVSNGDFKLDQRDGYTLHEVRYQKIL